MRPVKERDELKRAHRIQVLPYAMVAAGFGLMGAVWSDASLFMTIVITLGAGLIGFVVPLFLAERGGQVGASIFMPSGSGVPSKREYSLADSLVARGRYDEAVEAYALLAGDFPDDPEPRVRVARLLRDRMLRWEDGAEWFKRALAIRTLDAATEVAILRELIELYTHKLKTPGKALPFLARLVEKHATHPAANWARELTQDIKQDLKRG